MKQKYNYEIIRDMLGGSVRGEIDALVKLDLTPQEYDRFSRYLLNTGLAELDEDTALKPTTFGQELIKMIDFVDSPDGETESASDVDAVASVISGQTPDRLRQEHVLAQAELIRLETLQKTSPSDPTLLRERESYRRRLTILQNFLEALDAR